MTETYFIDPKRGIYFTRSVYHDDIECIYVVDFDKPDVDTQFRDFMLSVKRDGAKEHMVELKRQFRGIRELLG